MKTAAVCIATYRREEGLIRLLDALASQRVPSGWSVEIRVVNNDSDADRQAFREAIYQSHPGVRIAFETRRNIAHARNTSIDMGLADAYLFIDDDELPCAAWMSALLTRIDQADAVFGPVTGRPDPSTARWLVASGCFDKPGPAHDGEVDWRVSRTSSTAVRCEWLHDRGLRFDPDYGTSGGSDVELFRRMQTQGARFVHERRALVFEDIEADRCNWRAVLRRRYRAGGVLGKMQRDDERPRRWVRATKRVTHGALVMLAGLPLLAIGRPGTAFFGLCRCAVGIGAWRGHNPGTRVTRYPSRVTRCTEGAAS